MTVRILRWKGGYAGDMVMCLMHLSGYKIVNVNFLNKISQFGRVIVDSSNVCGALSEIDRISLAKHFRDSLDDDRLAKEIRSLDGGWIKSHYYNNSFDDITTDIGVDPVSLPFVMSANVYKTDTLQTQIFCPIADRVKDADVRIKLALYNVGIDSFNTTSNAVSKISVSDLLQGWNTLCTKLDLVDIHIDPQARHFYQNWLTKNKKYFAGSHFLEAVKNPGYDPDHNDLSLAERYALLVLKGQKFQLFLDHKEIAR